MDKLTKKVIELLKEDARYSMAQIANMLKTDEKAGRHHRRRFRRVGCYC